MNPLHHTVSLHVAQAMLQRAQAAGHDRDALLHEAGISPALLDDPASRLLPVQFANLMRALWRLSGDEFMGFTERPSRVGTFPLMMHAALNADTLGEALRHGCHFYRVLTDEITLSLREELPEEPADMQGTARFVLRLRRPDLDTGHVLSETILLCWYRFACWLINRRILLSETTFDYPAPAHVAEYHQLYPCPHHFAHTETTLVFDARLLSLPITRSRDELKALIRELPLGFFIKPVFQGSFGHRVRSRLLQGEGGELPGLDAVAADFFVTGRTLRRKLLDEGTSFQEIKDGLRRDQAMTLLRQTQMPIQTVAQQVGFREATVFIKAFRQWTGMTPGDYRARTLKRLVAAD
jgi:AraC-like DNA-binding protein